MDDDYKEKQQEDAEEQMVEEAYQKLVKAYLETKHRKKTDIIQKAFNFAKFAHRGVRRLSGEPYIMHPITVAQIVCSEIGLGSTSICAALLHDVVEDTDYTVEDIENMFGPKIAQIVDGLTKIAGGIFGENASAQAENFKKLLLTMNDDIRVILIKIADRLHNMRTLGSQPKNKQYKIAGETLYIYAPLAHRLGLNRIKNELENLSFHYEHPQEYDAIVAKLKDTEEHRNTVFDEFTKPISAELNRMGIQHEIKARIKTPYSIWKKMKTKNVEFEEVFDILAVRIIFEPKDEKNVLQECFNIYVTMCNFYRSHPDRLRDWVTHPKANGYKALHVTLMSKQGEWIEVQIRSRKMDEIAEKGVAAHWKYKHGDENLSEGEAETELEKWLTTIKELLDDPQPDAMDFLDTIKLNLFASEIFVFTPKGELKTLPAGSTVLDFAFSIHSILGSHCIGAKVNHKLVAVSHKLNSGDQVEILAANTLKVKKEWLKMATTAKATNKIHAILRKEENKKRKAGEDAVKAFFEKEELPYNSVGVEKICKLHHLDNVQQLYLNIAEGSIQLGSKEVDAVKKKAGGGGGGWKRLFPFTKKKSGQDQQQSTPKTEEKINKKKGIVIDDEALNGKYVLADCCKPIPGDLVMGYINEKKQITIHKVNCRIADRLKANHGNRIVEARWNLSGVNTFLAKIQIQGLDRIAMLNDITKVISTQHNVNMKKLVVECDNDIFNCTIQLMVKNTGEVDDLIKNLKEIKGINSVNRL